MVFIVHLVVLVMFDDLNLRVFLEFSNGFDWWVLKSVGLEIWVLFGFSV